MQLLAKFFIKGKIETLTGLSIGGSNDDVMIGGIDNNVIKTSEGVPFIPGSSLKGKLRSLLEKTEGKNICNCGNCDICAIFGTGAASKDPQVGPTRLFARDALMNDETKEMMENKTGIFKELELTYTEGKWENTIDRKTSKASNPRQTERVPASAKFDFELVFNILEEADYDRLKELIVSLRMLEDDYLGSSGSRGYGRIKFVDLNIGVKTKKEYESDNEIKELFKGQLDEFNFEDLKSEIKEKVGY
ncbi:type III-A CRISPR-associated RAMP protein Csm3 [Halanaerobium congolense]|jgi:CRISPR-associated protein Csm3|uniref:CRISPR system Cms endoribonuclease Csm3 n=1 Tax=Halanaerobium congolense TaxID=54121 RepID=A0A1G6S903_9FIRM|nr:type III-A CRISPR-associated RAMP protein Csm3 [Halanaerobium congolense]SDD13213.1 CRISPR-associated protein, Csm3 family [Halanaerobium congolense]SHN10001.1 CRISPR-associated protein, Csm3 family [Halanaerobium congolense]